VKKINFFMLIQWLIFVPLIVPISIIIGAFEGLKMAYERALNDIHEVSETY
jgi:hypothetical protein